MASPQIRTRRLTSRVAIIAAFTLAAATVLGGTAGCSGADTMPLEGGDAGGRDATVGADVDEMADASPLRPVEPAEYLPSRVVSFEPGACAGFGQGQMPGVVLGLPEGAGDRAGGLDVVSLGTQGSITLAFDRAPIVDGPGPDFIVFENAFVRGGRKEQVFAELARVSVSEDGVRWRDFDCSKTSYPYGDCAGWHPVYSASNTSIRASDVERAGGDAFDLKSLGLSEVRFVRITDTSNQPCKNNEVDTNGFDLDAIVAIHVKAP
jgi:hypothetical protein